MKTDEIKIDNLNMLFVIFNCKIKKKIVTEICDLLSHTRCLYYLSIGIKMFVIKIVKQYLVLVKVVFLEKFL
ncbi:MAG: hypothetical protein COZ17_12870 [Flavobacteriaceae bacterium CG_4_10_14_3_um_filter_33_47]|nr:MAG: hypothetical protein COW44_09365 [Flavobacteriaceae bacterium CG17_big_fil_post_rev_8_21_14_2_50_33_15]PIY09484.1 MAG: hypothetical protein COZ17_12870 [Flavobacteriaceae bacterium CG_4_10_14_3_um_filter_33_47]PJB16858.1 MAG: hypothetical protein CO117_13775 [Flavobacteriaceae bacterium CG_4_9_14_3_um_filter_33_16]